MNQPLKLCPFKAAGPELPKEDLWSYLFPKTTTDEFLDTYFETSHLLSRSENLERFKPLFSIDRFDEILQSVNINSSAFRMLQMLLSLKLDPLAS